MVLVDDLRDLHKTAENTACEFKEGPVAVLYLAGVDFCIEDISCLGLAHQEALDAPYDQLVDYVLLGGKAVLGQNQALIEAGMLAEV